MRKLVILTAALISVPSLAVAQSVTDSPAFRLMRDGAVGNLGLVTSLSPRMFTPWWLPAATTPIAAPEPTPAPKKRARKKAAAKKKQ